MSAGLHWGILSDPAGAFKKMVAGEVKQLRVLLAQQAAPQLSSTIQILDGPIAAATAAAGPAHPGSWQGKAAARLGSDAASSFPALAAGAAAAGGADAEPADADLEGCSDTGGSDLTRHCRTCSSCITQWRESVNIHLVTRDICRRSA